MKIIGKFYLKGGQTILEEVGYKKANEKVTDKDFREEIEKIVENNKLFLSEEMACNSTKFFSFGSVVLKIQDISAFQIIFDDEEKEEIEGGDLYKEFEENDGEIIALAD